MNTPDPIPFKKREGEEPEVAEVKRDPTELVLAEIMLDLAVMKTDLKMMKWMMSGIGFGMLLLLVRAFCPA